MGPFRLGVMAVSLASLRLRLRPLAGRNFSLEKISELEEIPCIVTETTISLNMEQVENIPSVEEDVKDVTVIGHDETDDSMELNELKERANKLSEQLKMLNTSEDNSEVSSMVEINEDEPTIIETKKENETIEKQEDQSSEAKGIAKEMNNETAPKKQRNFVKLLNKSDLGDSLEEVNNILVG